MKEKFLSKGAVIGCAMPASPYSEDSIAHIKQELHRLGYLCRLPANKTFSYGYLAGKDQERADAFMDLWTDPSVDIVWCVRGGYGCSRLLPYLDFNLLAKHPKMLVGMSDITALHLAFHRMPSMTTYLGPNLAGLFSKEEPMSLTFQEDALHVLSTGSCSYSLDPGAQIICEGVAEGSLIGGNLCLIASMMGTPWQIDARGAILVLEEINEAPYRVDRMLNQLSLSGVFDELAGVILGEFTHCVSNKPSLSLKDIFLSYFKGRGYPVIWGFPTGHIINQVMLPLGKKARLDTRSRQLSVGQEDSALDRLNLQSTDA